MGKVGQIFKTLGETAVSLIPGVGPAASTAMKVIGGIGEGINAGMSVANLGQSIYGATQGQPSQNGMNLLSGPGASGSAQDMAQQQQGGGGGIERFMTQQGPGGGLGNFGQQMQQQNQPSIDQMGGNSQFLDYLRNLQG